MKKIIGLAVAASAAAMVAPVAQAQNSYIEGGYTNSTIDEDQFGIELGFGSLHGRFGYDVNKYFGGEFDIGYGVSGEDIGGVEINLATSGGIYAKAQAPLGEKFSVHARAGLAFKELDTSAGFGSGNGIGYGAGARLMVSDTVYVRADYMLEDIDDVEFSNIGVTLGFKF
jgi:opacity protein-like surface antigen